MNGWTKWGGPAMIAVVAALGVATTQPAVAQDFDKLGKESEVYALPSEHQLIVLSLGYRAAAADLLFGRTMVESGIHFAEKRHFYQLDAYLKGIIALDPDYYDVYHYADSMLNLSTVEMPRENLYIAREIQERGLKRFPNDSQLWMNVGLFVAYWAPNRLAGGPDPDEKTREEMKEWRAAGARMLQHACDIWPDEQLPVTCSQNAGLLAKAGETEAAIRAMEHLLAVSKDPQARAYAMNQLARFTNDREARARQEAVGRLSRMQMRDLPGVSRTRYQLLVPPSDPHECVGGATGFQANDCASSFAAWSKHSARGQMQYE